MNPVLPLKKNNVLKYVSHVEYTSGLGSVRFLLSGLSDGGIVDTTGNDFVGELTWKVRVPENCILMVCGCSE